MEHAVFGDVGVVHRGAALYSGIDASHRIFVDDIDAS